jgi:hypothetical protein
MARENAFGRLVAPVDHRDAGFQMRAAMPQMLAAVGAPKPRIHPYNEPKDRLNQRNLPQCVSYAGKGFMLAAPLMSDPGYDTQDVYNDCQRNDEWPGENYDGTSVRALMNVLKTRGWIKGFVWGQSVDDAIHWMNGGYGTIIVGTNWYLSMDEVDAKGFMLEPKPTDTPVGGHAYRVNWWDEKKQGFLIVNSWGHGWGMLDPHNSGQMTGMAYMSRDLFTRLQAEDGEITAPTQVKIKATHV